MHRLTADQARAHLDVSPETLYDLVSDVTRTPEWSPEVVSCVWLDGATGPEPGARFQARNRRRWLTWSNKPVVEVADRGREFTISRTEHGGGTMRWSYRLTPGPAGRGTDVVLAYEVVRTVPLGLHVVLRVLFGVRDLQADLHQNIETSLERLAGVAQREQMTATS